MRLDTCSSKVSLFPGPDSPPVFFLLFGNSIFSFAFRFCQFLLNASSPFYYTLTIEFLCHFLQFFSPSPLSYLRSSVYSLKLTSNSPSILTKTDFLLSEILGDFFTLVRDLLLCLINTSERESKKRRTCAPDQVDTQVKG